MASWESTAWAAVWVGQLKSRTIASVIDTVGKTLIPKHP
jgi:hypothetical protein